MKTTFQDILNQKSWDDYDSYVSEGINEYVNSLASEITQSKEMKKKIRAYIEKNFDIKTVDHNLDKVESLLLSGKVIGIDGTVAKHKTISGMMAQIGVIAVNYLNQKIQHSYFISEAKFKEGIENVSEYLFSHEPQNQTISNLVIRAVLFYREREIGLSDKFVDAYKIYHGPLLPFELMTGLGKLRALNQTLEMLENIIKNKKCFSIISRSQNDAYIKLGTSLNPGEYLLLKHTDVGKDILENKEFLMKDKWREDELFRIGTFLKTEAHNIKIGVIKISQRPYLFHAHKSNFDHVANIIARDSMFQREKGFPLLIDYADNLCSTFFKASDFNRIIEYKLAQEGEYFTEMSEELLRQK